MVQRKTMFGLSFTNLNMALLLATNRRLTSHNVKHIYFIWTDFAQGRLRNACVLRKYCSVRCTKSYSILQRTANPRGLIKSHEKSFKYRSILMDDYRKIWLELLVGLII
jgi:hypothetical protein